MSVVGKSDHHNVERNCRVFHVVQHAKGDVPYFQNEELCKIRERAIEDACLKYKVRVLHTVTMPDHTHDIVIVSDVDTMFRFYQSVNVSVSKAIRRIYGEEVANKKNLVFSSRPAYVPIVSLLQYYSTVKYLFDNPKVDASLGKGGFEYPHSSFRYYRNGTWPPYASDVPQEKLFGADPCEIVKLLEYPKRFFIKRIVPLSMRFSTEEQDEVFKLDSSKPFTDERTGQLDDWRS